MGNATPRARFLAMTITMYGEDWCGDCVRAKAFFADNNVEYTYVNLEETPDQVSVVLERNNNVKRIPVIVFPDDSHLVEPSNDELSAKMAELSGATSAAPAHGVVENGVVENGVVENTAEERFELIIDGELVSLASFFARDDATVVIPHVGTEPEHRGQGYATKLMDGVVAILRETNRKLMPLCPFAAMYMRDRPEHHDVLA